MFDYDYDEEPYDDDERFYEKTAYNEGYYIEREQESIRESNFEIEFEDLEGNYIREMREEGLLRPAPVKSEEQKAESQPETVDPSVGEIPF
ncbi:MAG: hypothetical protein MOB07_25765 [Acidobacteria bacterium]|nr:hypothetical protein [Acidobacteriota bacterium]